MMMTLDVVVIIFTLLCYQVVKYQRGFGYVHEITAAVNVMIMTLVVMLMIPSFWCYHQLTLYNFSWAARVFT